MPFAVETIQAWAEQLLIEDKATNDAIKWKLNEAQVVAVDRHVNGANMQIHAKPRQVGMSTIFCFLNVIWVLEQAETGSPNVAIVLDTLAKAVGRLELCLDFATQLGLDLTYNRSKNFIEFPNGSKIVAFGADQKQVGSSYSFGRFHLSETPYWEHAPRAWGSLEPAMSDNGSIILETTCESTDTIAQLFWALDEVENCFYPTELFARHREDPNSITDERWEELQKEGYTVRAAAAWFNKKLARFEDKNLCWNLFPQLPAHLFQVLQGVFIKALPKVAVPIATIDAPVEVTRIEFDEAKGERVAKTVISRVEKFEVYKQIKENSVVHIGVDTSGGKSKDCSTIVVWDDTYRDIVGSYVSNEVTGNELAHVLKWVIEHFTFVYERRYGEDRPRPPRKPLVFIEENGVGHSTTGTAKQLGLPHTAFAAGERYQISAFNTVKTLIETEEVAGHKRLIEECSSLYRDEDSGKFKGKKDYIVGLAMCLKGAELTRKALAKKKEKVPYAVAEMRKMNRARRKW